MVALFPLNSYDGSLCSCETRGKYASKESHAFEAYCDVHLALKASPCGLAIFGNNRLSLLSTKSPIYERSKAEKHIRVGTEHLFLL
jgi:hypothetical protein